MKPMLFGKYCLLERISVGGMAEVFRSKPFDAPDFRGYLALKRILPHLAEDDEFIKMFVDEAKLTVQLNHPNIVRIYELGQFQASYYILMEFISGKDVLALQKTMRRQRNVIPIDQSMFIAHEMARGLHFTHFARDENGNPLNIIHRDVSPQNVLIDYRGRVKIIDFGIAKAAVQSTRTQVGVLKGKMGYMSPEQVRGEALDFRSDVFAIGTVLWEMLTNRRLFHADNEFETMRLVREASVEPPSSRNPDIPPEVDEIVMRALTRDPEDRYESAGVFADAIAQWLGQNPFTADDLSVWMRTVFAEDLAEEREKRDQFVTIVTADDVRGFTRARDEAKSADASAETPQANTSGESASAGDPQPGTTQDAAVEHTPPEVSSPGIATPAADGSPPGIQGAEPPEEETYEKTEIWDAEILPDEGEDLAAFAAQHTVVQAGGFDVSQLHDEPDSGPAAQNLTPPSDPGAAPFAQAPSGSHPSGAHQPVAPGPQQPHPAQQFRTSMVDSNRDPTGGIQTVEQQGTNPGVGGKKPPRGFYVVAALSLLMALVGVASVIAVFALDLGAETTETEPAATGALVINVTPANDIAVLVDGKRVGDTAPVTAADLTVGPHVVEVKAEGYKTHRETVEVDGITQVSVSLISSAPPTVTLTVAFPEQRSKLALYLDGERKIVPPSGTAEFEVDSGPHLVEAVQPDFRPFSTMFDVEPGETNKLDIQLMPVEQNLEILANSKALVSFNGKRLGRGNVTATEMNPFEIHEVRVEVRSVGVSSWSSSLGYPQIAKGSIRVDFDQPLPPRYKSQEFGYLQVSTGDDWWEVFIDDVPTGFASPIDVRQRLPVNAGKHKLTFRRGDTTIDRDIEIVAGETFLFREDLPYEFAPSK